MKARAIATALLLVSAALVHAGEQVSLEFKTATSNAFSFDTGVLQGTLRAAGASKGLSAIVHKPSGTRLDSSMGLFGHYRILGKNKRYGDAAWYWPSEARLNPDGSVTVSWAPAPDRPFALGATYRWAAPDTLDMETTIKPETDLPGLEVFLASYFSAGFTNAAVWTKPGTFTEAVFAQGHWQAFPKDAAGFALIQDGRWTYPPNPVEWTQVRNYEKPLALRRSPVANLTAVLMARAPECYAVLTPFQTENHRSMYFALFGEDARAGQERKAHTRLVITTNISETAALELYKKFANSGR